jgi:hypothetical protein
LSSGVRINYDDQNQRLGIAGLYGNKRPEDIEGIYYFNKVISNISPRELVELIPIDKKWWKSYMGEAKQKNLS